MAGLEGGVQDVDACECIDTVGGIFGPPLEPLEERLYLLVQVQLGSPCQLQVSVTHGVHKSYLEKLLAGLECDVREVDSCDYIDTVGRGF